MDELGMSAYRADHSQQIGRITDQMFSSILNDDLSFGGRRSAVFRRH